MNTYNMNVFLPICLSLNWCSLTHFTFHRTCQQSNAINSGAIITFLEQLGDHHDIITMQILSTYFTA